MPSIHIRDLSDLPRAAREFLRAISSDSGGVSGTVAAHPRPLAEGGDGIRTPHPASTKLIALYAPMGAGKTTFTAALCHELGVQDDAVSSPTFAIVNEYRTRSGESLFHFDFYRIQRLEEALDIGLYDYLDSGCMCIMEWPENIEELLPEETLRVHMDVNPDGSRTLSW